MASMALRVLFTTQPGLGHLFPLLPVADGLCRRGHDVAFATSASFAPDVAAAGHAHFAAGLNWVTADMAQRFPEIGSVAPGPERYAAARSIVFAGRTAIAAVPDLLAAAERWRPDLIVHEAAEYAGPLCAELLGLPHTVVRSDSGSSSYADRRAVADALAETRRHVGLPPDPDAEMPFRYLQLSFAPPGLDETQQEGAPTCHRLRPIETRPPNGQALPWLDRRRPGGRGDRPTVYVTLGTVYNSSALLATILEALAAEPVDLLMTVGPGEDPEQLGPQPANVHIARWIPQDEVLPHCDAVITHGGYGTVSAALRNGLPLVVVPISADQPLNARRCRELGVSATVAPDERTPDRIRAATLDVLGDPTYRQAAQRIAAEALRRPDLDHALDLVETLARDRLPLPLACCRICRGSASRQTLG